MNLWSEDGRRKCMSRSQGALIDIFTNVILQHVLVPLSLKESWCSLPIDLVYFGVLEHFIERLARWLCRSLCNETGAIFFVIPVRISGIPLILMTTLAHCSGHAGQAIALLGISDREIMINTGCLRGQPNINCQHKQRRLYVGYENPF